MPEEIVRVLRVYEFVGPRAAVEKTIALSVHGTKSYDGKVTINAATLGLFPEILRLTKETPDEA